MRLLSYSAVLVIALGNVVLGLDWMSAPMPAMPEVDVAAYAPPPAPARIENPAVPPSPAAAPLPVAPPAPPMRGANIPAVQAPPQPKCDVAACAAAYRTFRASDCTYVPSFGERRLCTKGVVPTEAAAPAPDAPSSPIITNEPAAQPNPACNFSACAAAYHSFRESDCTYQPSYGPRRLCAK